MVLPGTDDNRCVFAKEGMPLTVSLSWDQQVAGRWDRLELAAAVPQGSRAPLPGLLGISWTLELRRGRSPLRLRGSAPRSPVGA